MPSILFYLRMILVVVSGATVSCAAAHAQSDLCQTIKEHANTSQLQKMIVQNMTHVPFGKRHINLETGEGGTAHMPYVEAVDAQTHELVNLSSVLHEEDYWGGDHLGLVTDGDVVQILHYRDMLHPVATIPVSGGPACRFEVDFRESVAPDSLEPALCNRLIRGESIASIVFEGQAQVDGKTTISGDSNIYGWLASDTEVGAVATFDVANDGAPRTVVQMSMASSAGAGCDETFYDLLDESKTHLATDDVRPQLLALQRVDLQDVFPIRAEEGHAACGDAPRFFAYRGKTYFEIKPAQWPPEDEASSYHRVARLEKGNVVDVCHFSFATSVK